MKSIFLFVFAWALIASALHAQSLSHLNSDPNVVYLDQHLANDLKLHVVSNANVFSDKNGSHRLGTLLKNQVVKLEAMTERAYRVRGKGSSGGIVGWVGPKAFALPDEPNFIEELEKLYTRQIAVQELIRENQIALGMNQREVALSLGEPQKKANRRTAEGQTGTWDYIKTEEEDIFNTLRDPLTGAHFRQFSHTELREISRTTIEFVGEIVTAISETTDTGRQSPRIIIPPITFHR